MRAHAATACVRAFVPITLTLNSKKAAELAIIPVRTRAGDELAFTNSYCRLSGCRPRHAIPARDQSKPQGDAANRRQAPDPDTRSRRPSRQRCQQTGICDRQFQGLIASSEDHFDTDAELEGALREGGKDDLLNTIQGIVPPGVTCIYIRQGEPLGLGHAVLCARPAVGRRAIFRPSRR